MYNKISQTIYHETKSKWAYLVTEDTIHLKIRVGKDLVDRIEVVSFDPFNWAPTPSGKYIFRTDEFRYEEMTLEFSDEYFDYYFIEVSEVTDLRFRYGFLMYTDEGIFFYGPRGLCTYDSYKNIQYTGTGEGFSMFYNYPYFNYEDIYKAPAWVKDTIWYQIFPATFASRNNNKIHPKMQESSHVKLDYVGDILGIVDKLDYLKELGINGIYFTPLFESGSIHKYDTRDYTKIDSSFGTNQDFKRLVKEAHKRNIKVMLDGVFNHCAFDHPFFQDVIKNNEKSKYKEYFFIKKFPIINFDIKNNQPYQLNFEQTKNLNYRTFGFAANMPKLNTGNTELQRYILEVCKTWIRDYDIDGWRLDVSNEVSHSFWRAFRKEMKSVKEDIYIIGENWENSYPWLQGDQFDGVMNFELMYRIWAFLASKDFVDNRMDLNQFIHSLNGYLSMYPKPIYQNMFNFLDNHDTPRIINIMDQNENIVKLAFVLLMIMPGTPSIYYGTEQLIDGEDPGGGRKNMNWDSFHGMHDFLKTIISLRKNHQSMSTTNFDWSIINNDKKAFKLIKSATNEILILYFNASPDRVQIDDRTLEPYSYLLTFEIK